MIWIPNIIIVGMQRSATTSLYEFFKKSSLFNLSIPKETHFFSRNYHYGFHWYSRCFDSPANVLNKRECISIDICPSYLTSLSALSRIKHAVSAYSGSCKIIVISRDLPSLQDSLLRYRFQRNQISDLSASSFLKSDAACELVADSAVAAWQHAFPDLIIFPFSELVSPGGPLKITSLITDSQSISAPAIYSSDTLPRLNTQPKSILISNIMSRYIRNKLIFFSPRFFGKF